MHRPSSILVVVALTCLNATPSLAGSYTAGNYSGGMATWTGGPPAGRAYGTVSGGYGISFTSSGVAGQTPTLSLSGAITRIYTWSPSYPGDLAPQNVIVTQNCSAAWSGFGTTLPTGSASNGLGKAEVDVISNNYLGNPALKQIVGTSSSPKYSVVAGGNTVTVTCTPAVQATGVPTGALAAGLTYSCAIAPVTLSLTEDGAAIPHDSSGSLIALIGQHMSSAIATSPLTPSTWSWTIPGTTFQAWSKTTPAIGGNPANPNASYEVDGPGTLSNATAAWFWDNSGAAGSVQTEQVSCTVVGTFPDGTPGSLTESKPVKVYIPNWSMTGYPGDVEVYQDTGGAFPNGSPNDFWLAAIGPSGGHGAGMAWQGSVTAPANTSFGDGTLTIVQLINPGLSFTSSAGSFVTTQTQGLDGAYPYAGVGAQTYSARDNPGIDLTTAARTAAGLNDQFVDTVMYCTPGNTQCVPVSTATSWSTSGSVTEPGGGWVETAVGTVTGGGTFAPGNTFPSWTQIYGSYSWGQQ